jgi:hypothetical protein
MMQFADGEMPEMPDGEVPTMPDSAQGEAPEIPTDAQGNMQGGMGGGMQGGGDMQGGMGGGMGGSSDGIIEITGGTIFTNAGGDGIDSNGTLKITGGTIHIIGPTTGDTSILDFDLTGEITGGTFLGSGAVQMAQTFTSSEQGVITKQVNNQSANTKVTLSDSSGNVLLEYTPNLPFALVILSSPDLVSGETYTLTVGSSSVSVTAS